MAMKKLYAKTSFTSKKPSSAANSTPILAYHQQQHQQPGNGICEFQVVAPGHSGELMIRRSQSMHHKMSPPVGGLGSKSEYYSIEELQELDLLDYRHPMYHHYQQQELRQRYHEHEQLVLHLPKATSPKAGPIYEAPQRSQQQQDQMLYVPTAAQRDSSSSAAATSIASSSTLTSSPSPSSSSSLIFSTLRKCVSPSNPSVNPNQPSKTQPSKLGCSMSFSIRTTTATAATAAAANAATATLSTQQQQQQAQQQHKQHLYSNIHHYLIRQQQQKQHYTLQRRHNSVKDKFIGGITTIFAYV